MVIDLPRVRRALSALDQIAAEHPELRQGSGRWADHLEELDRMTKPAKNRMQAYRARLRERGWRQVAMFLNPEALARLDQLRQQHPDSSIGELVSAALVLEQRDVDQVINPTADYQRDGPVESPLTPPA